MSNQLADLERRIADLERLTRPLKAAKTAARSQDDATLAVLCSIVGVDIARIQGDERGRNVAAVRRVTAEILRTEYKWTPGRIARAMRKTTPSVQAMLR